MITYFVDSINPQIDQIDQSDVVSCLLHSKWEWKRHFSVAYLTRIRLISSQLLFDFYIIYHNKWP